MKPVSLMKYVTLLALTWSYQLVASTRAQPIKPGITYDLRSCGGIVKASPDKDRGFFLDFTGVKRCSFMTSAGFTKTLSKKYDTYNFALYIPRGVLTLPIVIHNRNSRFYDSVILRIPGQTSSEQNHYPIDPVDGHPKPHKPFPGANRPPISADSSSAIERACRLGFDGKKNENRCLQLAIGLSQAVVKACESGFDGDTNELKCLQLANEITGDHIRVIRSCEMQFDGDQNELTCLEYAGSLGGSVFELIEDCAQKESGDQAELACLKRLSDSFRPGRGQGGKKQSCWRSCSRISASSPDLCTNIGCAWESRKGQYFCKGRYNICQQ
ncbi:MAG: hypothetical protein HRU19_14165 [Pseudobacteriovorax sp.]|nr:hypothetical protein [Pseudobacteriovorax sp.]